MLEPVSLTPKAAEEVQHIMNGKKIPEGYALRIAVKGGGGCGGAQYILGFDKPKDGDLSYKHSNIPILVEKKQAMYLLGLQVDFYEGNDARGFMFTKPEAEVRS